MDKKIKKKWVTALRSGKYKQGRMVLRYGDRFCCLGVLCDLHSKSRLKDSEKWQGNVYMQKDNNLPSIVRAWADLSSEDPITSVRKPDKTYACLSDLNDGDRCRPRTFKQIAAIIEKQL